MILVLALGTILSCPASFALSPIASADVADLQAKISEADALKSSNPDRFRTLLAELGRETAKATPSQRQSIEYLQIYDQAVYRDQFSQAIRRAAALFRKSKDPTIKYRVGTLIVNLSALRRTFSLGIRYLDETIALHDSVADPRLRHDFLAAAAIFYNELGQYQSALTSAEKILDAGVNASARNVCVASLASAEAQYRLGRLKDDDVVTDAISRCSGANESIGVNLLRATLARKWSGEGGVDAAVNLLEDALPGVKSTKYPRLIAEITSLLAELKLKQGKVGEAERHAQDTVGLGDAIASSQALVSAYGTLYQIAEERGRLGDALALYKQYSDAEKARINDIKARDLAVEMARQVTAQKNQQIERLERQGEVMRLQQELDRQSALRSRLAMVFLLLVLAGVMYWMLQIKRHQRQLKRLAQTDMLTGIGNRHYLTQKSEKALLDAAREGEQAALVMFDLDHFKAINDTYGHGAGDWVLKQVGKVCKSHCKSTDFLGRIGGEEFAVLLRGVDLAEAARIAEDCRAALAQIDTRESGYSFVVTGSFGVTSTAQSGYDFSRLLSHADQMLYRAKHEGRNRVCVYAPDGPDPKPGRRSAPALTVVAR